MKKSFNTTLPLAAVAIAGFALSSTTTTAAPIAVSSYVYGANAESQPQPTNFQGGSISDVGNLKLTDGQLATGNWNDGTNVGFRNDSDNGNPQPEVTFDLGAAFNVMTIEVWSVSAFLGSDESVSISSSVDGVTFSAVLTVDPLVWTGGFPNANLRQASVDVSSLPGGQFYRLEFLDPSQWHMINEIGFDGDPGGPDIIAPTIAPSDFVDNRGGGPVFQNVKVTYTLTFDDDMDDAIVNAGDFDNAGTATITVGAITETGLGVFTVEVTPTSTGTLELRIPIGATMTDDAGNPLDTGAAIVDDTSITVDPPDMTAPTLAGSDIVDDQGGRPVNQGSTVTYTITFDEDMDDSTVDAADFGNAGSSNITIGAITETSPGVFSVAVTPTDAGTLRLEVVAGASLTDASGNPLDTAAAIAGDSTLVVEEPFPGSIAVVSYEYGANPESQPQPTNFQGGSISDLVEFGGQFLRKLTDGQLATGSWNDLTNVGFRNDAENGEPQPRVTFDFGGLFAISTIEVYTVSAFLTSNESVSISSSADGVTFSAPVTFDPLAWVGGFANSALRLASVDVSSLPPGQFYQLDFLDPQQWMMINEVVFYGGSAGPAPVLTSITWLGGDLFEVTMVGDVDTGYEFLSSTTLMFDPGIQVENLTQGDPGDPGTIGGDNNSMLTTDSNGDGTVRMILTGDPSDFIRAQIPPPPPPLLEENFDGVAGPGLPPGWSTTAGTTAWEVGDPEDGPGTGPGAAVTGLNCAGTGIITDYDASTTYSLLSPPFVVPVGGATLRFQQYIDTDEIGDLGTIRVLDADNADALIVELVPPGNIEGIGGDWTGETFLLPTLGNGRNIKIEFRFVSDDNGVVWSGFYIDDVLVEAN